MATNRTPTHWNVRNTNSTPTRQLWHRVARFAFGPQAAHTVCGKEYLYPQPNTVFTQQLGECTPANTCERCYDGN